MRIQNRVSASLSFTGSSYCESEGHESVTRLHPHCAGGIWLRSFHSWLFYVHTTPEKIDNATITRLILDLCLILLSQGKITWLSLLHRFLEKFRFKMFSSYTKTQSRLIKIPPVWRAFSAAPFLWRISADGRPNLGKNFLRRSMDGVLVGLLF